MIVVSIGVNGNTILENLNIKDVFSAGSGYRSNYASNESLLASFMSELRSTENEIIKKSMDLARNSSTPDNAAKKIRKIVEGYSQCIDLYSERLQRMKDGEAISNVIREYFFSEDGKRGILPIKPVAICGKYNWNLLKKQNTSPYNKVENVPRIMHIEITRDMSIGEARLFTMDVKLGYSNEKSGPTEEFTELGTHVVSLTMERVEKD